MKIFNRILCGVLLSAMVAGGLSSCGEGNKDVLTYRYDYDLSEYIDLAPYKNLDAKVYNIDISDEKVQNEIYSTLAYYAKQTAVTNRGAKVGDTVKLSYTGSGEDGAEFESETDKELILGMGELPDEVEAAIEGHYAGDKIEVDLTLPTPYESNPDYSGKDAHFSVELSEVSEQELPLYTDDFVRGYLGYDSIEDYETSIREELFDHYNDTLTQYVVSQTWTQVVQNTTVKKYPKAEVDKLYNQTVEANRLYAESYKIEFASYIRVNYELTEEEFYEQVKEYAEETVKEEMISYAIARAENISLTDEEYTTRATEYALEQYELDSLEAFEALYNKESIRQMLLYDKVKEFVAENANRTLMTNEEAGLTKVN